ncbi:THO complex subunit 1 [Melipona bicolor]|uniref:THO complex subunit 1 n=1 Tax=Melipona bicolor TaxID=60889 RepID=A0AA40GG62_9HYME|nr:THO complex subunit 1 [Melipona bicolor]
MPVMLLGDIFDSMTLDRSEQLFTFVENNVVMWKKDLFFSVCKNNLLRMCNDLLRRLFRSQQTVFSERILLFLAKFFLSLSGLVLILLVSSIWKIMQNLAVKNQKEMI